VLKDVEERRWPKCGRPMLEMLEMWKDDGGRRRKLGREGVYIPQGQDMIVLSMGVRRDRVRGAG